MSSLDSVTQILQRFRSPDAAVRNEAAADIWRQYATALLETARRHLHTGIRRREDEHDVLQSVYKSFCLRQQNGDFDLKDRHDLWNLLLTLTLRKTRNVAKRNSRQRRDYRRDRSVEGAAASASSSPADFDVTMASPPPEEELELYEELQGRLRNLPNDLQHVALWKLQGYTNEEIAGEDLLNCSVRTVERKLNAIRQVWLAAEESFARDD